MNDSNHNNNRKGQQKQNGGQPTPPREKCPRCDSTNTKFCYYNNYSKTQPRHFCKGCKRHWTLGGTLRAVPVGGARKNKRLKTSNPTAAAASTTDDGGAFRLPTLSDLPQSPGLQMFPFSAAAAGSSSSSFDSLGQSSNVVDFGNEMFMEDPSNRYAAWPWESLASVWNWGDLDALVPSAGLGVPWDDDSEIFKL